MRGPSLMTPLTVSRVCVVSVALVVSSVAGRYGTGFDCTISGLESAPLWLTMRANTLPPTATPSILAIGTATQWLLPVERLAGMPVLPALSACQPLRKPMSPRPRSSTAMTPAPPRLGTSCQRNPLARSLSTGFTRWKLVS
jgi:hypothetical protein